jgi:phosphopantetheinyl transferase (holo-ACP synthase)
MLGNDVVDLADPETACGGQHPRFDARVFASGERAAIAQSSDPVRTRWILWAVKESAFKGVRRTRPETVFSPAQFVVGLDSQLRGTVRYRDERYFAIVEANRDFVHAIVSDDHMLTDTLWGSRQIEDGADTDAVADTTRATLASRQARALALDRISAQTGIDRSELSIERDGRIPQLAHRGVCTPTTLSLSHHGSYVSFGCRLTPWSGAAVDWWIPRLQRSPEREAH